VRRVKTAIELYPAIDVRGGRVVRLSQGDYAAETVYGDDPVAVAVGFADAGATWVHVVDLDAARTGDPVNRPVVARIAAALAGRCRLQCGGGVRTTADVEALAVAGVARVVMGSAAVREPRSSMSRRRSCRWRSASITAKASSPSTAGRRAAASVSPRHSPRSRRQRHS